MISSSQRPPPENTQYLQQTNIHSTGGIRTHSISRRAAAGIRPTPRGHWDRQMHITFFKRPVARHNKGYCGFFCILLCLTCSVVKMSSSVVLDAFAESSNATANFVMSVGDSVRPSVYPSTLNNSAQARRNFMRFHRRIFFGSLSTKFKFHYDLTTTTTTTTTTDTLN